MLWATGAIQFSCPSRLHRCGWAHWQQPHPPRAPSVAHLFLPGARRRASRPTTASTSFIIHRSWDAVRYIIVALFLNEHLHQTLIFPTRQVSRRHGRDRTREEPLSTSGVDTQPDCHSLPVSRSAFQVAGGHFGEERGSRISPCDLLSVYRRPFLSLECSSLTSNISLRSLPATPSPPSLHHHSPGPSLSRPVRIQLRRLVALQTPRPSLSRPDERSFDECGTYARSHEFELPQWQRSPVSCIAKDTQATATMDPL